MNFRLVLPRHLAAYADGRLTGPGPAEDPLTARSRAIWTAGDFQAIARGYAAGAAAFVERLAPQSGMTVLDVACGAGGLAIPAAASGATVTGVDLAPYLVATAIREAKAAGVGATFDVGDAEALPYADRAFDLTMSMFGAMFAARPERAAAELLRVTRPGGRIAMANWTPGSFVGRMFRAHAALLPPPPGLASPLGWGDEPTVRDRFGDRIDSLRATVRQIAFRFPLTPAEVTGLFATCYGPTVATLRALEPSGRRKLREDLEELWAEHNVGTDGSTVVWSEYLEVVATVR